MEGEHVFKTSSTDAELLLAELIQIWWVSLIGEGKLASDPVRLYLE